MATVEMTIVTLSGRNVEDEYGYEYEDTLAGGGNGDWILIPVDVRSVAVTCSAVGTTAKVQTTTDLVASVEADTAVGVDWDDGAISSATSGSCVPPTAIRLVQTGAGSSKLTVRAQ